MGWNDTEFSDSLKKKYDLLAQNANADTTRAGAAAQDVAQKPGMQEAGNAAELARAQLAAQNQKDIAASNNTGAMARAELGAGTDRYVADSRTSALTGGVTETTGQTSSTFSPSYSASRGSSSVGSSSSGIASSSSTSDDRSKYREKGGPVKAGEKYIVGEGGKDEVYVQDDGDVYPLTERQGIIPKEDGTIIPNKKLRKLSRVLLNNKE